MRILIFGATGSIGTQSIGIINKINGLKLVGISFYSNLDKAKNIIINNDDLKIFSPIKKDINNVNSYDDLIKKSKPDMIINAISGFEGFKISILSIKHKINLALANKESIVVGGTFLLEEAKKNNVSIYPIDSEITSIFSLLKNNNKIKKIILSASGGKFFNKINNIEEIDKLKFSELIKHPKWSMGEKISIDSSTMINKYFEMIEAFHLFNCEIDVVQHSEAFIHSMIQYLDGSIHMYASKPDMKIAIQNVLTNFSSNENIIGDIDFDKLNLSFNNINEEKWLPIKWAKDFFKNKDLSQPIIINSANDALFILLKNNEINFSEIIPSIEKALNIFYGYKINNIDDIFELNDLVENSILGE